MAAKIYNLLCHFEIFQKNIVTAVCIMDGTYEILWNNKTKK